MDFHSKRGGLGHAQKEIHLVRFEKRRKEGHIQKDSKMSASKKSTSKKSTRRKSDTNALPEL
jgi:hypothetical protein